MALILHGTNLIGAQEMAVGVIQRAWTERGDVVSCNVVIPFDNTAPLNTEGVQVFSLAFTPKRTDSRLRIQAVLNGRPSTTGILVAGTIFKGSDLVPLVTQCRYTGGGTDAFAPMVIEADIASPGTSELTYTVRVGPHAASTFYLNGNSNATAMYNTTWRSYFHIEEYL